MFRTKRDMHLHVKLKHRVGSKNFKKVINTEGEAEVREETDPQMEEG